MLILAQKRGKDIISVSLLVAVATRAAALCLCRPQQKSKPNMLRNVSEALRLHISTSLKINKRIDCAHFLQRVNKLSQHNKSMHYKMRHLIDGRLYLLFWSTCWSGVRRSHYLPSNPHLLVAVTILLWLILLLQFFLSVALFFFTHLLFYSLFSALQLLFFSSALPI